MDINYELYKIFYYVALTGSISKGASRLNISQPAVTQSIQTLEGQLGGKLFIRTPKGVTLTSEGMVLYNYVKEGMNFFINGTNKFNGLKELDEGYINIGSSSTISKHILIPYIREFHKLYPNIVINLMNDLTDNLFTDLRNGTIDIVLTALPKKEIKDITSVYLMDLHDVFISSKPHKKMKIKDLLKGGIILQKYPSITRSNFNDFVKDKKLEYNVSMEIVSHSLLVKFVENKFGIGLATLECIDDKKVNIIETDINIPTRVLGYSIKKGSIPTFSTSKFIEILKKPL